MSSSLAERQLLDLGSKQMAVEQEQQGRK